MFEQSSADVHKAIVLAPERSIDENCPTDFLQIGAVVDERGVDYGEIGEQGLDWNKKIESLEGWYFGGKGSDYGDKLLALVVQGKKSATCMWEEAARVENVTVPKVGELSYIMNSSDQPVVVIETIELELKNFLDVDERFARDEGEGDLSYAHWKKVHEECFAEEGKKMGLTWDSKTAKVYCERFRVVHFF